jgi:LmbE family N-acetylglucosaminyl deacetylase
MTLARSTNAVVVAHPDDEAIWLSSVVASADRIIFGFGDVFDKPRKSEARRRAVAALPLSGIVNLGIPESGAGWKSSQVQLERSEGNPEKRLQRAAGQPELTPYDIRIFDATARARYESNYAKLLEGLRASLAGCRDVYTHNPWGEYGHSEHIQVYNAVTALQDELGYTVWFSNYVSGRNWTFVRRLAERLSWARRSIVTPDVATARKLMRVYQRYGAWTYQRVRRWPAHEVMYAQPPRNSSEIRYPLAGEWLLDVERLRWWSPPWRSAWRCLSDAREPRVQHAPRF